MIYLAKRLKKLLPVYKAQSFERVLRQGGRTQPWVVLVNEGEQIYPYVVKMFAPWLVNEFDAVTNEVLGNKLATLFDLPVPNAALIDMDDDFIATIDDVHALEHFYLKDDRIKFGTRLISPVIEFRRDTFSITAVKKIIDIDTVFAFDHLIQNRDRNNPRANFLINNGQGYLIDHEKAFELPNGAVSLINSPLAQTGNRYHIFYNYLRRGWVKTRAEYFGVFTEYLKTLNINELQPYFNQLAGFGFSTKKHGIITDYLSHMKINWSNFDSLMKGVIS